MVISPDIVDCANELRSVIQEETDTISDGEGVAMVLLWSFLADHARAQNLDIEALAREQLEAFIEYARGAINIVQSH